jgi:hypothetical protein
VSLVLQVDILGEYKNLSKATKGAQDTMGKLGDKFATVGKNIGKVVAGIGLGLGAAVASQIKPAIDAASDLGEATNAVNVAFGDAAEGILKLGENSARGLGLSKTELFGISTQFSNFAKTIAGEGGDVVKIVDEISTRGADFASVFNLDVSEALAKFQSGLAGQSEPLRAYGIDISAANVEAYALANGIGDGTGALTEQEKVLARYGLIMEQTAITQGDFTNTSDSLANQQRITAATIEDLRAKIGESLLPVMEKIMTFILEDIIPAFENFYAAVTDPAGEAQRQFGAIGDAWEIFVSTFNVGATEVKQNDVFKWIGDSVVSTIRNLTHLATFVGEIFDGMSKIFQAGFGVGPLSQALRLEGIRQVSGAMGEANRAASSIRFSDEIYRDNTLGTVPGSPSVIDTININIPNATVNADRIIDELNAAFKSRGLATIGTAP